MATLGERLKQQNTERLIQDEAMRRAETLAAQKKVQDITDRINQWVDETIGTIVFNIDNNLPMKTIKVKDVPGTGYKWVVYEKDGKVGNTDFDTTYNRIVDWGTANGLKIAFVFNHDGVGLKSWHEIKVKPL